jgi:hypothetical protein
LRCTGEVSGFGDEWGGKMEKRAPNVPPHFSKMKRDSWIVQNENEKCVLTIDKFYDDMENFDNLSVDVEAVVDSVEDGLKRKSC